MLSSEKIAFIGAGKAANSLIPYLISKEINVYQVISKNFSKAIRMANEYNVPCFSDSVEDIQNDVSIVILSVPDDQIIPVASSLNVQNKIVIHLSGAMDITALEEVKLKGNSVASIHIMQSFPKDKVVNIEGSFCAVETDNANIEKYLMDLCTKIGLNPFAIKSDQKVAYHLAGVFASNFLFANLHAAQQLLKSINKEIDVNILFPIIEGTIKNIETLGLHDALTGPLERGDSFTIRKHLSILKNYNGLFKSYIAQSNILLEVLEKEEINK